MPFNPKARKAHSFYVSGKACGLSVPDYNIFLDARAAAVKSRTDIHSGIGRHKGRTKNTTDMIMFCAGNVSK